MRLRVQEGTWPPSKSTEEGLRAQRLKAALAREALGLQEATWIGMGEQQLYDLLIAAGHTPIPQFALDGYNFDFKLDQVLIEVYNPVRECQRAVQDRRVLKEVAATRAGLTVLYVPSDHPEMALDLLKNEAHDFEFVPVTVGRVERRPDRPGMWSCEVADDESYVVKGIVHHNCRPPNNLLNKRPDEQAVIDCCRPYLDGTIQQMRPRCIVPMGEIPLQRVLGLGKDAKITPYRGYPVWADPYASWVLPTFHPAYVMRGNARLTGVFLQDLFRAIRIAKEGYQPHPQTHLVDPSLVVVDQWVARYEEALRDDPDSTQLAYDIETPYKMAVVDEGELDVEDASYILLRVGFAYGPEALSLTWMSHYLPAIRRLLASPGIKLVWNGRYDQPRLLANHVEVGGPQWDIMYAWHVLNSDLEKGLGFVAPFYCHDQPRWKHLAKANLGLYNAIDAAVTWRIAQGVVADLKQHDLWAVFARHVVALDPILSSMGRLGLRIDGEARRDLSQTLMMELAASAARMEAVVPLKARRVLPKQGYVRAPAETAGLVQIPVTAPVKVCTQCGQLGVTKTGHTSRKRGNPCYHASLEARLAVVERWARLEPFVPSKTQMLAYQAIMGHHAIVGRSKRKEGEVRTETFDEPAIKKLMTRYRQDRLYPLVLEYRGVEKLLSTYVGEWKDDERD